MRKPSWKNSKVWFVCFTFLSLLFWSGCAGQENETKQEISDGLNKQAISVEVVEVQEGNFSYAVRFVGETSPMTSTLVFPEITGNLEKLYIEKGDLVQENQVLGEMKQREYLYTLKEAEIRLKEAQARLEQAQTTANTMLYSQLEQMKRLHELATENYHRTQSLVEVGALPLAQLDAAEAELLRAQQNLLLTEEAEEKKASTEAKDAAGIEIAKQTVKQAELNLERAQIALQDTHIKAKAKGRVAEIQAAIGDQLTPQQPLAKIIDLEQILVTIQVLEEQLDLFYEGQVVNVFIPALTTQVEGKVSFIGLEADKATQMFPLEISVDNPEQSILPGMKADVLLAKQEMNEGILLPREAVFEEEEQKYVYILVQEKVEKRAIQMLDSHAQEMLVHGIQAGDKVVVKYAAPLHDQAQVRLIESKLAD